MINKVEDSGTISVNEDKTIVFNPGPEDDQLSLTLYDCELAFNNSYNPVSVLVSYSYKNLNTNQEFFDQSIKWKIVDGEWTICSTEHLLEEPIIKKMIGKHNSSRNRLVANGFFDH